jgi:hypothetical protein
MPMRLASLLVVAGLTGAGLLGVGCDPLWGGSFGNDPEEASRRMARIPDRFAPGELRVETVWEPGEGTLHMRYMYASRDPECSSATMDIICAETGRIRATTGATVEAWCHGTPRTATTPVEVCEDGRRRPRFIP